MKEEILTSQELSQLKRVYGMLCGEMKVIGHCDLAEALKNLGSKASKKEIEEMIWEVDENLDGYVDWDELKLMFERNVSDETGLEPSKLFHLVQFLSYDQNANGKASVDETMKALYARYGRAKMEVKLKELFGEDMREYGIQGGEIDFTAYTRAVDRVVSAQFGNPPQTPPQNATPSKTKTIPALSNTPPKSHPLRQ